MRFYQRLVLSGVFLLTACGFTPIYGAHNDEQTSVGDALSAVAINNIPDENGQTLRNKLIDRLYFHGRPVKPEARLAVALHASESGLGLQKDATTSLSQLHLAADFSLSDMDGKRLLSGSAHSYVTYAKLDAQYGTLAAQRNAYERAIDEVGEQIVNRLSLYYAEPPGEREPQIDPSKLPSAPEPEKSLSFSAENPD